MKELLHLIRILVCIIKNLIHSNDNNLDLPDKYGLMNNDFVFDYIINNALTQHEHKKPCLQDVNLNYYHYDHQKYTFPFPCWREKIAFYWQNANSPDHTHGNVRKCPDFFKALAKFKKEKDSQPLTLSTPSKDVVQTYANQILMNLTKMTKSEATQLSKKTSEIVESYKNPYYRYLVLGILTTVYISNFVDRQVINVLAQ